MQPIGALLCVLAALQPSLATRVSTASPVEKVVQLLQDLKTKIESDGAREQQVYDKYACWCEKATARKAEAITTAQGELRSLGQKMLSLKGAVATFISEIEELVQKIQENKDAQAQLTSLRQKENGAYMAETAEMKEVLNALERAIIVLKEGTKLSSFLQQGSQANAALKAVVAALPATAVIKPAQMAVLSQLVGATGSASNYAPQSVTVQGILRDMYETFAADLEGATATEARKNREFEQVIAQKVRALNEMEALKAKKEGEKAKAEADLAERTQLYEDTEAQMKADIKFFDETKEACTTKHSDWVTRSELRSEELQGIASALDILTSDAARELFASTIKAGKETHMDNSYNPGVDIGGSFLQLSGEDSASAPAARAYASLKSSAKRAHSLRLAALAVRVHEAKVGHFDEVLKAIDAMIATLKDEDAADISKRDQCLEEYQKSNSTIANVEWLIRKNEAAIDKLERLISNLEEEKEATIKEIENVQALMAAMTQQRQEENQAFKNSKKDDQDAINLLMKARTVLSAYYEDHGIEFGPIQGGVKDLALAQQGPDFDVSADQAPEAVFSGKGKRKRETKGIVQLLTMIIEDLADEIRNAMKAEELAQLDYEKQLAAAKKLEEELSEKRDHLADSIGKRQQDLGEEQRDKATNEETLQEEKEYKASITTDCDWIIGAFTHRAKLRADEMAGLVGAKEFLAGYQPSEAALLDKKHGPAFHDAALSGLQFLGLKQ